jgi:PEGA domain-containing protein
METNRCSRCRGVVSSLLVVIASFCAASMTHAAPRPSMKELLANQELERQKTPFPLSVRIAAVTITEAAGRKGEVDDRWHSSDAFRSNYDQEFADGLAYYLKQRGFKLSSSKGAVVARVYIDGFTGRKGSGEYGGDLKGTLFLRVNGKEVVQQPLSESVNYRNDKEERRAFEREFSLDKVNFSTVVFYNLTVSLYDSIATAILDVGQDVGPDADRGSVAAAAHEASPPTRESPPPVVAAKVQPPPPQPPPQQPRPQAPPEPPRMGILTIESNPEAAEIYLDSKLVATTPVRKLRLTAGDHSITIRKAGYLDWVRDFRVLDDADVTLQATLQKSEPGILNQEEPEEEKLDH